MASSCAWVMLPNTKPFASTASLTQLSIKQSKVPGVGDTGSGSGQSSGGKGKHWPTQATTRSTKSVILSGRVYGGNKPKSTGGQKISSHCFGLIVFTLAGTGDG